jgi:hypothetical protein
MVREWANARNLIKGATPKDQMLKLVSEYGELYIAKDRAEEQDSFGDSMVVLTLLAAMYDARIEDLVPSRKHAHAIAELGLLADLILKGRPAFEVLPQLAVCREAIEDECALEGFNMTVAYDAAYNEIKDRKGVMYNGAFIKSTDPAYGDTLAAIEAERNKA